MQLYFFIDTIKILIKSINKQKKQKKQRSKEAKDNQQTYKSKECV